MCGGGTFVPQIILSRESEVLAVDCEMASVHGLLSKIPERLSYEQVIVMAQQLFEKHPPQRLARNEGLKLGTRSELYRYSERKCLYSAVKWYFPHSLVVY